MKGLLLLSGGIDSPVAGLLMKNLGVRVIGVHFHTQPFTKEDTVEKSAALARITGLEKLYVVPIGEQSAEIVKKCNHKYYFILTRRLMWRVAEALARKEGCDFLITGENLGQVSSQTLHSIAATDNAVKTLIARPLLTNDKSETVALAKKLGTYDASIGPEMCCALGPKHPVTRASIKYVEREEAKLNISAMVEAALRAAELEENI